MQVYQRARSTHRKSTSTTPTEMFQPTATLGSSRVDRYLRAGEHCRRTDTDVQRRVSICIATPRSFDFLFNPLFHYSARSATIGSTPAARHAGISDASSATKPSSNVASVSITGSDQPLRLLIMGFKIPPAAHVAPTPKLMLANADDVPYVLVAGHGPTVRFKLLMGTTESKRDKLAAASQMVSLFIMDFASGGTNIPHHHEMAEEIYYILRGHGDMVAGGGDDGNEGRHPAKEGDAFFIRLNATVGFYGGSKSGEHDEVLAVRSRFPFPQRVE